MRTPAFVFAVFSLLTPSLGCEVETPIDESDMFPDELSQGTFQGPAEADDPGRPGELQRDPGSYLRQGEYRGQPTPYLKQGEYRGLPAADLQQGEFRGQPTYLEQGEYRGEPTYLEQGEYRGQPADLEQGEFRGQPADLEQGEFRGQPTYLEQGEFRGQPADLEQGEFRDQSGPYLQQGEFRGQPTYLEQGEYRGQPTTGPYMRRGELRRKAAPRPTLSVEAVEAQGTSCLDDSPCPEPLSCIEYTGISAAFQFASCEISCVDTKNACPEGQACTFVADGPGLVCRPVPGAETGADEPTAD